MGKFRVLCADDEEVVRKVIERIFRRREEVLTLVASADAAVAALAKDPYDLVISDIRMPGGGGQAVAEAAKRHAVPVVFITGYAESGLVQEFIEAGAIVVRKPFTPAQLITAVEQTLAGRLPPPAAN